MTAADIWNYSLTFIQALGPAILVVAIVANIQPLIAIFQTLFNNKGGRF